MLLAIPTSGPYVSGIRARMACIKYLQAADDRRPTEGKVQETAHHIYKLGDAAISADLGVAILEVLQQLHADLKRLDGDYAQTIADIKTTEWHREQPADEWPTRAKFGKEVTELHKKLDFIEFESCFFKKCIITLKNAEQTHARK